MSSIGQFDEKFWQTLDVLVSKNSIFIDRPRNSVHPRYADFVYPYDYGYLSGTASGDGDGIDVWIGSEAGSGLTAIIVTVDVVKRDSEIKLLLHCSKCEQQEILAIHNRYDGQAALLIERPE
jgi:inorganic pyrophosphatase